MNFQKAFYDELEKVALKVSEITGVASRIFPKGLINLKVKEPIGAMMSVIPHHGKMAPTLVKGKGGFMRALSHIPGMSKKELRGLSPKAKEHINRMGYLHEALEYRTIKPMISKVEKAPLSNLAKEDLMRAEATKGILTSHQPGVMGQETRILKSLKGGEADKVRDIFSKLRSGPSLGGVVESHLPVSGSQLRSIAKKKGNRDLLASLEYSPELMSHIS